MKKMFLNEEYSLTDQCFESLKEEILNGILKPGVKLKILELKDRFNISQSTVRESLSKLVAVGLAESEENKGFSVAPITEETIRDCYAVMTEIEKLAVVWSIQRGSEDWQAQIVAALYKLSLVEKLDKSISYDVWQSRNYEFHKALISGCNSQMLIELREQIYIKMSRFIKIAYNLAKSEIGLEENYECHKSLADAVLSKNIEKAEIIIEKHINSSLELVIKLLKKNNIFNA